MGGSPVWTIGEDVVGNGWTLDLRAITGYSLAQLDGATLVVTYDNGYCTDEGQIDIEVGFEPVVGLTADDTEVCLGTPVILTATNSGDAGPFVWTINNDTFTAESPYTFNPTVAGVYSVSVSVTNNCGTDATEAFDVTVYSLEVTGITTTANASGTFANNVYSFCVTDNGVYELQVNYTFAPGTATPEWYNSADQLVASGNVLTITTPVDGAEYYVTIDGVECADYESSVFSLNVNEAPELRWNIGDDRILTLPDDEPNHWFSLMDYATYSKDVVYQWKVDNGEEGDDDVANWANVVDTDDVYDGATTDKLWITGTQDMDGFRYALVASNGCGTDISLIGTLYVEGCAEIATNPEDAAVSVGLNETDEATFTVTLSAGDEDFITYKWYMETVNTWNRPLTDNDYNAAVEITGDLSIDGAEFTGYTTNELTVSVIGGENGWNLAKARFWVEVIDECIDETDPVSEKATLDVFDAEPESATYLTPEMASTDIIIFTYTMPEEFAGWFVIAEQTDERISYQLNDGNDYGYGTDERNPVEFMDYAISALDGIYLVGSGEPETEDYSAIVTGLESTTDYSFKVVTYNDGNADDNNYYNRNYNNLNANGNPANYVTARMFTSDDQELPNKGGSELSSSYIVPNPASDQFTLNINLLSEQNVRIAMYDNDGKMVLSIVDGQILGSGDHSFNVMLQNIASGTYSVLISAGEELIIEQIVVKK
jgi:hypothetical protein